ncbi:hypothetical protein ANCDUO_14580 [Ancylostoma duodenale]|uniref:Uncharacterized protein n=1 Tax=Ancylostoma duodenale TaxID=51022 RepID=A0A0C2CZP1_9BILA|nr:hypothetical protein ANCDUO_14580 [Ancylostoma duodenale]
MQRNSIVFTRGVGCIVTVAMQFWLAVELLVPLILFVILALVRTRDFTDFETHCEYFYGTH